MLSFSSFEINNNKSGIFFNLPNIFCQGVAARSKTSGQKYRLIIIRGRIIRFWADNLINIRRIDDITLVVDESAASK